MDPNPYETPKVPDPVKPPPKPGRLGLAILLGLLSIPASVIACFTTCIVGFNVFDGPSPNVDVPIVAGAVVGLAVAVTMIVLAVRTARR